MSTRMQPLAVLTEESERTRGEDAQDTNVQAGKAVASSVRTTLGPRGMDKMLVDSGGDVVITNDGATILGEMDIEHPAAQMIVEVSESQEESVGDGTTTAAVLTGELLSEAESLFEDGLHPTVVAEGYSRAAELAHDAIDDQVDSVEIDDELLQSVAESSMTGKGTGDVTADRLASLVVDAVQRVRAANDEFDADDIKTHTQTGASSSATDLLEGVVIDAERAADGMPTTVTDASVAVLDVELDLREGEVDAEYTISSVDQLEAAVAAEDDELREYASTLADAGADVVFSTDSISDRVASYLAREDIVAFEDIDDDDARTVARATGASRLGRLEELETSDLVSVDSVSTETYGEDELTVIEGGAESTAATLLIRGGTEHVLDELSRAIDDAINATTVALDSGVVPGAGGTEIAISDAIRSAAAGIEGRQQLAVESFADAVDAVPRTLAQNTGMDPIDAVVDLRSTFENEDCAGLVATEQTGEIANPLTAGIVDPAAVKHEAITAATEATTMIVRIDDVISSE